VIRATVSTIVVVAALVGLTGCTPASRSETFAEEVARDIGDRVTPRSLTTRDAEFVAAQALEASHVAGRGTLYSVETLGWEGRTDTSEGARVTLRIRVDLPEIKSYGFASDVPASATVKCWDLVVRDLYDYDPGAFVLRAIVCPDGASALQPDPASPLRFPEDAEALLIAALTGATVGNVEDRVRSTFPEPGYAIAVEENGGELVVAVELWSDCMVAVQHGDGTVTRASFDPVQILPGETGCSPALYLRPVVGN
jgi:hypothetical protein